MKKSFFLQLSYFYHQIYLQVTMMVSGMVQSCAYFDQSQDVVLTIKDGKAKVDWGEEFKPTKYRGRFLKMIN